MSKESMTNSSPQTSSESQDKFDALAYEVLLQAIRQKARHATAQISDRMIELSGLSREEFALAIERRALEEVENHLGKPPSPPQRGSQTGPQEGKVVVSEEADEPDESHPAIAHPDGKLALVEAMLEEFGIPFITGRLYFEVISAAGFAHAPEMPPSRRGEYGGRRLHKIVARGYLEIQDALPYWPARGNPPRRYVLTPKGEIRSMELGPELRKFASIVVEKTSRIPEVKEEVQKIRDAVSHRPPQLSRLPTE